MTLRQDLKRVQEESKSSTSTTAPFQTLKNLDLIKTNLEKCVRVLQETGNWNGLVKEMESYFASKNLGEVASRLAMLRGTMETLKDFPEAPKRADIMERMEQRLESLVRPGLQNALEQAVNGEYEPLKQSVIVFSKLGRQDALLADFGQSRGRICFEACWAISPPSPGPGAQEEDKYVYSRFLDRVLVHLREVELPICRYAFASSPEAAAEALAHIAKYCFKHITSEMVIKLLSPRPVASSKPSSVKLEDVNSCERYVAAYTATARFVHDMSSSLLAHVGPRVESREEALQAIRRPFEELNRRYLEWEGDALEASLAEHFESLGRRRPGEEDDGLDDVLGPSGWEQRMARVRAEDILEQLTDESVSRCARLGLGSVIPVCRIFETHALNCLKVVREPRKADDAMRESGLLKTVAELRGRFASALSRCARHQQPSSNKPSAVASSAPSSPAKPAVIGSPKLPSAASATSNEKSEEEQEATRRTETALESVNAESRQKLFNAFVSPAIALIGKVVNPATGEAFSTPSALGPSESITKAVDHLLSLIPMVEFENPLPDLYADALVLGKAERDELAAAVGGPIPYAGSGDVSPRLPDNDPEELSRLIAASWLEAVGRAMCTAFVLRVLRLKKVSDAYAAQLGADADCLEKNTMLLAQGVHWDPALGICRVVMSAGPGLTHLKLGNPAQHLDDRYFLDASSGDTLKSLEHLLVALRNRS